MSTPLLATNPKTGPERNFVFGWFRFLFPNAFRRGDSSIRRVALPEPLAITGGRLSHDSRCLLWAAAEQIRGGDFRALSATGQELRRRLGSLTEPLGTEPTATDRTFLVDRVRVASETSMEALALAVGASAVSLCLAGQRVDRLGLVIEHVAELAELTEFVPEVGSSAQDLPPAGGTRRESGRPEVSPHALAWLGRRYITRWIAIHQVFFGTMSATGLAMRVARDALETGYEERGLIFIGLAESLIQDGVELFSLTPTGLRYRWVLRPYMASIAPGLSGGEGSEHAVFVRDYRRLISFESDRPCVMAALGALRGAYVLAFDRHRSVCAHAVGQRNGSLKNPDHDAPEVLGKLKATRTSRCPMHRFLKIFTKK